MRVALIALALASATAPASARPALPGTASPLHGYVLGRYAAAGEDLEAAARWFDAARDQDRQAPELARRAFELAVASGNQPRAFALAAQLARDGSKDADVALVRLADAVLRRDWSGAAAARTGIADVGYAAVVGPIVDGWTLFGKGDTERALARLDPALYTGFTRSYITEQRAHMLAAVGRHDEAAALYGQLRAGAGPGVSFIRVGEADALAMAGRRAAAETALIGDDPPTVAARARLAAGDRIGMLAPDPRRGIAWMAARLATDLSRERPVPLALLFARTATFLAPDMPAAWLVCGDVLARGQQREAALLAYARVPSGDALAPMVAARRTEVLELMGRGSEAGATLRAAALATGATAEDWTRLADWHRRGDRHGEAADAYARALALAGPAAAPTLRFLRGSMLERGGRWPEAEAELRAALAAAPEEASILNYLGYSLLDRGEKPDEAAALIEKAARLRPGDGGIVDSLGWSQYRRGAFAQAVETLEKAAALEPTDPTIAGHLGDAYWRVGRRIEARFRWRQALDLDPDARERRELQSRLDYGLDAAPAMLARN